jgi:DNA-binding MarR family transcriptional regulator
MPQTVRKRRARLTPSISKDAERATRMELANRIFFRLYQCANMLHRTGTRAVESDGLTTQRWAVLGALSRDGASDGMGVGELARYLMVSRQSLAGLIDGLTRDGHVTIAQDRDDLRSRRVALTRSGRALWLARARPRIDAYYAEALAGFSVNDLSHTLHYLLKLLANLERLDAGDGAPAAAGERESGGRAAHRARSRRRSAATDAAAMNAGAK